MRLFIRACVCSMLLTAFTLAQGPTQQDLQAYLILVQFLTNQQITQPEAEAIAGRLQQEFSAHPAAARQDADELIQALVTVNNMQDPLQIGQVRQKLLAALYGLSQSGEANNPVVQAVFRRVQPLAFDAQGSWLLTESDLTSTLEYLQFANQAQGGGAFSAGQVQTFRNQAIQNFARMSEADKQFLTSGTLIWNLVQVNVQNMSQAQQQQVYQSYNQAAQPAAQSSGAVDPAVYQMMSQMSLQNHASMMNCIENIGGSGNYWEVVPSTW